MERGKTKDEDICTREIIVKPENLQFKSKRMTATEIDDVTENIRLTI